MIDEGNLAVLHTSQLDIHTQDMQQALKEVEQRHMDILQLEQSINELFELFTEVSILVDTQGEMIDVIEHNVYETREVIETTQRQLKQAYKYKKKSYLVLCPCYHCCVVM